MVPWQDLTGKVFKTDPIPLAIGGFSDVYGGVYADKSGQIPVSPSKGYESPENSILKWKTGSNQGPSHCR
jgi:hypothetical protein